ncbi:MAG: hypothetical protein AB7K24_08490 [Gemmataceae bacterium]
MNETRPRRLLSLLGLLGLVLYILVLQFSFHFRLELSTKNRPILEVLALLLAATLVYLAALAVVLRQPADGQDRPLTWIVVGFAVVYRLLLLPSEPIQEIDFYRYLWDGRVLAAGHNPFHYSQQQIFALGENQPEGSELRALWQLAQQSPALTTIFERVHHREVPTVYPPLAQVVFAATALLVPAAAPWWLHVLALKTVLVLFDLATLGVLIALLRQLGKPTSWCLAYAWCPLALKEFANSAHLDSIAVFFTALAVYLLVRVLKEEGSLGRACLAAGCLALAILAKSYPVVLLLLVSTVLLARLNWRAILPIGLIPVIVIAGYLPFATRPAGPAAEEEEGAFVSARPHHPGAGLRTFLTIWEMNDFFFMIVSENLRWDERERTEEQPARWFVLVPAAVRESIQRSGEEVLLESQLVGTVKDPAFGLTQLLMATLLLSVCALGAFAAYRRPEPETAVRGVFLTLFWGWMFASTQNPWYLLWSLPFMVFAGQRSYFLMPGLVLLYYVRFWLEYHAAPTDTGPTEAWNYFDFTLVWFEYLPFLLALMAELWFRSRKDRSCAS